MNNPSVSKDWRANSGILPAGQDALIESIDTFFYILDRFETEEETILSENQAVIRGAFETLITNLNWNLAKVNFDALLDECQNEHAFRADGRTPNWYHQLHQIVQFLQLIRSGRIPYDALVKVGGAELGVCAILRHDSYEDHGKTPTRIFSSMERRLHILHGNGLIDETTLFLERHKAAGVAEIVDLMTRKTPELDGETGLFTRRPDGKIKKNERYSGDLNRYYHKHLQKILAVLCKYGDSIDGVSTRILPDFLVRENNQRFSVDDNMRYADERRELYGRSSMDDRAAHKFPEFEPAIRSADAMLGIVLTTLETVNYYFKQPDYNPYNAWPIRIDKYLEQAKAGYEGMPKVFRPDLRMIGRLEAIARRTPDNDTQKQESRRMQAVLNHAIYPALVSFIGERRPQELLDMIDSGSYHPS